MADYFCYVLVGKTPISVSPQEWVDWQKTNPDLTIARDQVGPDDVVTGFAGLDQGPGDGPPMVFGTTVSGPAQTVGDRGIAKAERIYSTWQDAEAGHREIVERLRSRSA